MFKSRLFLSFLAITSLYMSQGLPGLALMPAPSPSPDDGRPQLASPPEAVCGNYLVEMGEECDYGSANGTAGCPCSGTCQWSSTSTSTSSTTTNP